MIPVEVTLSNFLGYDDNQGEGYTYNFADHRLWSISGDNGAGKSAIFDAITYCLFGRHRGGAQRDEELLHKGASNMSCSFTFDHFGFRYCVRRTLTKRTRRTGTVTTERASQIEWYDSSEGAWRAVDGTTSVSGLEDYVRLHLLGFDYDTFISSVLLLQGQSDKLTAAGPAQRFDYLSGILEFDRYRRLFAKSEDRVRGLKARHEVLIHQLGRVEMPSDQQLEDAKQTAAKEEQQYERASALHREHQQRYARVQGYHELLARAEKLASEVEQAEVAITRAPEIRSAAEAWDTLRMALPLVRSACNALCEAEVADEGAAAAKANAELIDLEKLQAAVTTTTTHLEKATEAQEANAHDLRERRQELDHLQPRVKLANRLVDLAAEISTAGKRIARLTEDTATFGNLAKEKERVDLLYRCLPSIQAFVNARKSCDELLAGRAPAALDTDLGQASAESGAAVEAVETLMKAVADRREAIAALKERLAALEAEHKQRVAAGDEGTCSRCGQAVSSKHIQAELGRCVRELARVTTEIAGAESELGADNVQLQEAQARLPGAVESEDRARDQLRRFRELQVDIDRLDAAPFMAELSDEHRAPLHGPVDIALTAAGAWEKEVATRNRLAKEYDRLLNLEAALRSQEQLVVNYERERGDVLEQITGEQAQAALATSEQLTEKIQDLEAQEVVLSAAAHARSDAREKARTDHSEAQVAKAHLESDAKSFSAEAASKRKSADQLVAAVGAEFRPPTLEKVHELEARFEGLSDAPSELAALQSAESQLATWRGQLLEAGETIARVSEDERIPLAVAATDLQVTRQGEVTAEIAKNSSRDAFNEILRIRSEHLERRKEADLVDRQRQVWQRVARLLGRNGLQLALLKRDLREIELRANPFLQQISGGSLSLRIECTEGRASREEIHFRCVDAASADDQLDVTFLSGGQKFRVAVALATGIGQYAGLGASMPSQIIDEGFGSLDEMGRREILEAIRDMSEHYERIIVVSHTDSFHDPSLFPARYELRKDGRRTLISATV